MDIKAVVATVRNETRDFASRRRADRLCRGSGNDDAEFDSECGKRGEP